MSIRINDDLGSLVQTHSFIHQHKHLEKLINLKKRFIAAVEEAEYVVDLFISYVYNRNYGPSSHVHIRNNRNLLDLFLSCVHIRNNINLPTSEDFSPSLNLDGVRKSFRSIQVEFMSMRIDSMEMYSSHRTLTQSAQSSISTNLPRPKKILSEIFVGLDHDAEMIRDKLVEDQKKLDVVSIVGMAGIGKTTLANKVFNDGYVKHHFHVRVWATVSQTYDKRDVLTQLLQSITLASLRKIQIRTNKQILESDCGQLDLEKASVSQLCEMVHKHLLGQRYLIVIDDIWHTETWDNLKLFFPQGNDGSRILLTTRLTRVAKHANSYGLIHRLGYLNKERSWELLCQKVFHGNECPEWSVNPGKEIVRNCKGLPLAVVVIAGILAKEALSEKLWVEIAERTGWYIFGEENGCLETLALSYNHLPLHSRECFLYLGCFPEGYRFQVKRLIWLWVAEGFIEEDGNRSLEDIAEAYLMDLIDRNLVIVDKFKSNGGVKACKVHDLVRELCLKKAREERFIIQTERLIFSYNAFTQPYKPVRMFINTCNPDLIHLSIQNLRSILWFSDFRFLSYNTANYLRSFVLLRVLDLSKCELNGFSIGLELLVHLRYLAIWTEPQGFPSSICNLWNLQTLIFIAHHYGTDRIVLPSNISDLVNLKHLRGFKKPFSLPSIKKPMNLHTISDVELRDGVDNFQKCFPYIKELTCCMYVDEVIDFKSLTYLEKLKLRGGLRRRMISKNLITLPATLKTLTLAFCCLPWSDMQVIQSLTNLQVLKLKCMAFEGSCWRTDEQEFQQLKFLRIDGLNIEWWEANSTSFPCLKQLEIFYCHDLEEIPLEIGDIPTLELIKIKCCSQSVYESARRIQEEQRDLGNYDLKIDILKDK